MSTDTKAGIESNIRRLRAEIATQPEEEAVQCIHNTFGVAQTPPYTLGHELLEDKRRLERYTMPLFAEIFEAEAEFQKEMEKEPGPKASDVVRKMVREFLRWMDDTERDVHELCLNHEAVISCGEDTQYWEQMEAALPANAFDDPTVLAETIAQSMQPRYERFQVRNELRKQYVRLFFLEKCLAANHHQL